MYKKTVVLFIMFLMLVGLLTACGSNPDRKTATESAKKLAVVASVYPVYEFAKQVGGDKLDLIMLVPPGAEPHDWEPKAKDLTRIKSAQVFLYHGAGLEPWIDKLVSGKPDGIKGVQVSKDIPILASGAEHGSDAHIWLDPVFAQQEVRTITAALTAADPANGVYYQANAERYIAELVHLDNEYREGLARSPRRDIVTTHAAFGYLAKRYALDQTAIMGLSPDAEPAPDKMASVVRLVRERQVHYIFFETLVSPKLADTIARETGAQTLVLNPVEGLTAEEEKAGANYLSLMRGNLQNLQKALAQ